MSFDVLGYKMMELDQMKFKVSSSFRAHGFYSITGKKKHHMV